MVFFRTQPLSHSDTVVACPPSGLQKSDSTDSCFRYGSSGFNIGENSKSFPTCAGTHDACTAPSGM